MSDSPLSLSAPGSQLCAGLLGLGLCVRVRVSGASMAPVLVNGDVVHLRPVDGSCLRTGDILFIQDPRRGYYLHRLLRRPRIQGQAQIQTRGHGQWRLDEPVSPAQVLARVTDIEHQTAKRCYWRWLAGAGQLLARLQLLQSACYYLKQRGVRKLHRRVLF